MKSAENNCGEGRNESALRPHTRHKKVSIWKSYLNFNLQCGDILLNSSRLGLEDFHIRSAKSLFQIYDSCQEFIIFIR